MRSVVAVMETNEQAVLLLASCATDDSPGDVARADLPGD